MSHYNVSPVFSQEFEKKNPPKLLFTGRHFWNRKCRKKTWWQTVNQSGRIDRTQRCWSYV